MAPSLSRIPTFGLGDSDSSPCFPARLQAILAHILPSLTVPFLHSSTLCELALLQCSTATACVKLTNGFPVDKPNGLHSILVLLEHCWTSHPNRNSPLFYWLLWQFSQGSSLHHPLSPWLVASSFMALNSSHVVGLSVSIPSHGSPPLQPRILAQWFNSPRCRAYLVHSIITSLK